MKKRWIIAVILLALMTTGIIEIWPEAKRTYAMVKQERELKEANQIVRVELAGKKFDIPLHYMYGETIEKYHRLTSLCKFSCFSALIISSYGS